MPFQFWRDPLCVASWALYGLNRFVLAPRLGAYFPFLREHLDDVLLIPAALPLLVWARSRLGLRPHQAAPTWREIWFWTALWAIVFEFVGPRFIGHSVGDWLDALSYAAGALIAGRVWNRRRAL
ncbi:MAG TPA: hypothetical protein VF627_02820 [Abditibacterium sp.]|jgi:hypothetical protein